MCNLSDGIFEDGREDGRRAERANTERERNRADSESARADRAEQESERLRARIAELERRLAI